MCFLDDFRMAERGSINAIAHILSCAQQKKKSWINDPQPRGEEHKRAFEATGKSNISFFYFILIFLPWNNTGLRHIEQTCSCISPKICLVSNLDIWFKCPVQAALKLCRKMWVGYRCLWKIYVSCYQSFSDGRMSDYYSNFSFLLFSLLTWDA